MLSRAQIDLGLTGSGDAFGVPGDLAIGAERIDLLDFSFTELEFQRFQVLGLALWVRAFRDDREAPLQRPADHHLRGGLGVICRYLLYGLILHQFAVVAHQWTIRDQLDALLRAVVDRLLLLVERVQLDLVARDWHTRVALDFF